MPTGKTTSDPYVIRQARREELAALPAIEVAAGVLFAEAGLKDVADNPPDTVEYLQSFLRAGVLHVAADGKDRPVGLALTGLLDGAGHLYELAVEPAHGKRGLGRRLVEASCSFAQARGCRAMTLSTFRDLAWNGPFYRRIGFRELRPDEWTPGMYLLHAREIDLKLPVERRCFMRREL